MGPKNWQRLTTVWTVRFSESPEPNTHQKPHSFDGASLLFFLNESWQLRAMGAEFQALSQKNRLNFASFPANTGGIAAQGR
jgi:hypothetical protein